MDATRWKATVHVSGIPPVATKEVIHDAFLPFGDIVEVSLQLETRPQQRQPDQEPVPPGQTHRGFAYVEFEEADDAKEAIDNMDQSELFGRIIKVSAAKIPKSATEGLNSKTAVWEQVRGRDNVNQSIKHVADIIIGGMAWTERRCGNGCN